MIKFLFGTLKRVIVYFFISFVVILLVVAFFPSFIPQHVYKDFLAKKAFALTGKKLSIAGPVRFNTFPSIHFSATDMLFTDANDGKSINIESINIELSPGDLFAGNIHAVGDITYNNITSDYAIDINKFDNLFRWQPAKFSLHINHLSHGLKINGLVQVARNLQRFALSESTFSLDSLSGKGGLFISFENEIPAIASKLDLENIDITALMAMAALPLSTGKNTLEQISNAANNSHPGNKTSIPFLTNPPRVGMDIGIKAKNVVYRDKIIAEDLNMGILTHGNNASLSASSTRLFDGKAQTSISIDYGQQPPHITSNINLKNFQIGKALRSIKNISMFEGRGNINASLKSRGFGTESLLSSLSGSGDISTTAAKIKGFDIQRIGDMRSMITGFLSGPQETNISGTTASFTINNGILSNNDLEINTPIYKLYGNGELDFARQQIDYKILTMKDDGSSMGPPQTAPIVLSGNLFSPDIKANFQGISLTKDAGGFIIPDIKKDNVKAIQKQLKNMGKELEQGIKKDPEAFFRSLIKN